MHRVRLFHEVVKPRHGTAVFQFDAHFEHTSSQLSGAWITLSVNILTTALILYRLTETWLVARKAFSERTTSEMYGVVARLVVEAAVPLAVTGIMALATRPVINTPKKWQDILFLLATRLYIGFSVS